MASNRGTESKGTPSIQLGDQDIPASRLHLKLNNPRHEPVQSEAEAIAELCNNDLVTELAQDIANRGALSPLEVFGVIPMEGHPGHFISLEGNRRACALILAADPKRAPAKFQAQIERIVSRGTFPKKVKAHVFAGEEEAKQWIDLRHLGEQGGAGTRTWNPQQQNRALGNNTKSSARANTLSVRVLDRLEDLGLIDRNQRKQASVTTLTRYLGTPGVRAILGLGSANDLIYTHDPDEVDNALRRVVLDSIQPRSDGTYPVNSRSKSTERISYANALKSEGVAPGTALGHPAAPPKPSKVPMISGAAASARRRSVIHPDKRSRLIPSDFVMTNRDTVLRRLHSEGRTLDIEALSFSANYILRALVEQVMTLFVKKRGRWHPNFTDAQLTQKCAQELKLIGVQGKALTTVERAAGNKSTPFSLYSLGHAVHGGSIPAANDLKKHFDTWRPALEAMLNAVEAVPEKKKA